MPAILAEVRKGDRGRGEGGREGEMVKKHLPAHMPAILAEVREGERGEGGRERGLENIYLYMCLLYWLR